MRKVMKGAVVVTMAAGLSLWNMETQEAVALAPITYSNDLPTAAALWEKGLSGKDDIADAAATDAAVADTAMTEEVSKAVSDKVVYLEEVRKIRVREHRLELQRARRERMRQKRLAQIQKCCGVRVSEKDRAILERIVEAEAGDQDHKGKLLVANVILNRVKCKTFPSTIQGVVFSPRQFSPISDGRYFSVRVSADTKSAVNDALNGIDGSQGALYFMDRRYSSRSNIVWFDRCLTRLFQHQGHEFYK